MFDHKNGAAALVIRHGPPEETGKETGKSSRVMPLIALLCWFETGPQYSTLVYFRLFDENLLNPNHKTTEEIFKRKEFSPVHLVNAVVKQLHESTNFGGNTTNNYF